MLFRDEVKNQVECKPGQVFQYVDDEYYLLSYVNTSAVALVSLSSGNRWMNAVTLEGVPNHNSRLSKDEWIQVTGGETRNFKPVTGSFIEVKGRNTIE